MTNPTSPPPSSRQAHDWLFLATFVLTIACAFYNQIKMFAKYLAGYSSYCLYPFSDWMINYQGGFVRRGIVGEVLLQFYRLCPYNLSVVIIVLYYVGLLLLVWLLVSLFRKNRWSFYLLPFPLMLYFTLGENFILNRRDSYALLLAYLIFLLFRRFQERKSAWRLVLIYVLSAFTLLMHEASFFFTFPILLVYAACRYHTTGTTWLSSCLRAGLFWLPALLVMALVCLFKGSSDTAEQIWASWNDCLLRFPISSTPQKDVSQIGLGVHFLSETLGSAVPGHFRLVWQGSFLGPIPSAPFNVWNFAAVYYLVTRLNTIKLGRCCAETLDSVGLSNVFLIQFVSLMPMYGFLSCDMGRVIPYLSISTLLFFHLFQRELVFPQFLTSCSLWLQHKIEASRLLGSPMTYFLILITMPLDPVHGANGMSSFPFFPYDVKLWIWKTVLSLF